MPWAISALAVATLSELARTSATTRVSDACMRAMLASTLALSSGATVIGVLRSPSATFEAAPASSSGSAPSARRSSRVSSQPTPMPMTAIARANVAIRAAAVAEVARASFATVSARLCCNWLESSTALNTVSCFWRTSPTRKAPAAAVSPRWAISIARSSAAS